MEGKSVNRGGGAMTAADAPAATTEFPRVEAGGQRARASHNALQHGLTSKTLVPEILDKELIQKYYAALCEEWAPTTATQDFLVRELARHQAALERAESIELAVLRRGGQTTPDLLVNVRGDADPSDVFLAAAGTSQALETISRYRRQHERAFLRTLAALREAQASPPSPGLLMSRKSARFTTEQQCQAYLLQRAQQADFRCPTCGSRRGSWLTSRSAWQCSDCRQQTGLRQSTVLEGSRLSLLAWFHAIELLANCPQASTAELRAATGIQRVGTLRNMSRKIQRAMDSPHASDLLAGLGQRLHQQRQSQSACCVKCPP